MSKRPRPAFRDVPRRDAIELPPEGCADLWMISQAEIVHLAAHPSEKVEPRVGQA